MSLIKNTALFCCNGYYHYRNILSTNFSILKFDGHKGLEPEKELIEILDKFCQEDHEEYTEDRFTVLYYELEGQGPKHRDSLPHLHHKSRKDMADIQRLNC